MKTETLKPEWEECAEFSWGLPLKVNFILSQIKRLYREAMSTDHREFGGNFNLYRQEQTEDFLIARIRSCSPAVQHFQWVPVTSRINLKSLILGPVWLCMLFILATSLTSGLTA